MQIRLRYPYSICESCRCSAHRSEVCGLKWSPDNRQLASGGNDNQLCIWSLNRSSPTMKFSEHTAAVKAIAWSPHQHGLLASGGGTADRCIRFWNTATNTKLSTMDTGSQVGYLLVLLFVSCDLFAFRAVECTALWFECCCVTPRTFSLFCAQHAHRKLLESLQRVPPCRCCAHRSSCCLFVCG